MKYTVGKKIGVEFFFGNPGTFWLAIILPLCLAIQIYLGMPAPQFALALGM